MDGEKVRKIYKQYIEEVRKKDRERERKSEKNKKKRMR